MKTPIKTLVKEFGLTHQLIADFLGIHRSIVTRFICGEKSLPDKAALSLQLIATSLQRCKQHRLVRKPVSQVHLKQRSQYLKDEILRCRLDIKLTERSIEQLKRRQSYCDNMSTFVSILQQQKNKLITDRHQRWLAERQYQAKKQAASCDPEQLWRLELQLETLVHQQALYEQRLTVIKNQINKS